MSTRRALLALLAVSLVAPLALASGFYPPGGATTAPIGDTTIAHWTGPSPGTTDTVNTTLPANTTAALWFGLQKPQSNGTGNLTHTLYLNLSSATLSFEQASLVLTIDSRLSLVYQYASTKVTTPAAAGPATFTYSAELHATDENGTRAVANATYVGAITVEGVEAPVPAPPTGLPTTWLVAGAAVLVVGGGAAALVARQRAIRRRMNAAPRRSQVMREMELEQKLEKAKAKDPEAAVVIQQEIRQAEKVREDRRELQILEAKRADALKTLDLLKKRHEAGGLTKLQYDNMVAKKRQDLERIEAEIAAMRGDDPGAAA